MLKEYMAVGVKRLRESRIQCADPTLHMKQVLQYVLEMKAVELQLALENTVSKGVIEKTEAFLSRRLTGEPYQYIVGFEWFWNSQFRVEKGVLIPRPETEVLLEKLLEFETLSEVRVGELGAGSGNIGISALLERPRWKWFAYEQAKGTIPYLSQNVNRLLPPRHCFRIYHEDYFRSASHNAPYDWIVSNPPYVKREDFSTLPLEVKWEPPEALDGGNEGLDVILELIEMSSDWIRPGGGILIEMGCEQGPKVRTALSKAGFCGINVFPDLAGRERVALGRKG